MFYRRLFFENNFSQKTNKNQFKKKQLQLF